MNVNEKFWDEEVDLVIAGSGAGGMTAAIAAKDAGLSVLVVEKAAAFGGSTALSGGGIWIPGNPTLKAVGRDDDLADVRRYLEAVVGDRVPQDRRDAYVEHGPAAMEMLHRVSRHMDFSWCPDYSDYHPEAPGGRPRGRTIEPKPIDAKLLGPEENTLLKADLPAPLGLWFTGSEGRKLMLFTRTWSGKWMLRIAAWRVLSNLVRRRHMKTLGASLAVRLRLTLKDLQIPLWLNAPVIDLVVEDDTVIGAVIERDGKHLRVRARRGVVIATGGFDHNPIMRKQYLPALGQPDLSAGAQANVGDGIAVGESVGGALDLMDDAWWMPSIKRPDGTIFPLVTERCIPSMVIVDQLGQRFTNEAAPYVNFIHDQIAGGHVPAWEIIDAKARSRYQFAGIMPGQAFPADYYTSGLVTRAATLRELARKIGVPEESLQSTVDRFNGFARNGRDEDFGRGDSRYDHYYGDPTLPNPNLDPIEAGPYYAIRLEVGDLGTKGGLLTDPDARVLRPDGTVLGGLYAVGNASASVMGNDYAGAGATIGPAITFGYLAARHAASKPA